MSAFIFWIKSAGKGGCFSPFSRFAFLRCSFDGPASSPSLSSRFLFDVPPLMKISEFWWTF